MLNSSFDNITYQVLDSQCEPNTGSITLNYTDFVLQMRVWKPLEVKEMSDILLNKPSFMRDFGKAEQQLKDGKLLTFEQVFGE